MPEKKGSSRPRPHVPMSTLARPLAAAQPWLGASAARYAFTVCDFHSLHLASLSRRYLPYLSYLLVCLCFHSSVGSKKVICASFPLPDVARTCSTPSIFSRLRSSPFGMSFRILGRRRCVPAILWWCRGLSLHRQVGFPPHSPNSTGPVQLAHTMRPSVSGG